MATKKRSTKFREWSQDELLTDLFYRAADGRDYTEFVDELRRRGVPNTRTLDYIRRGILSNPGKKVGKAGK